MVSTYPLISKSFSLFINPLGIVLDAWITISITVTFMSHSVFLVLEQGLEVYLSFRFRLILLYILSGSQVPYSAGSLFFFGQLLSLL